MQIELRVGQPVELSEIVIPDLWHVAQMMEQDLRYSLHARDVLDCWAMAHRFKAKLEAIEAIERGQGT